MSVSDFHIAMSKTPDMNSLNEKLYVGSRFQGGLQPATEVGA